MTERYETLPLAIMGLEVDLLYSSKPTAIQLFLNRLTLRSVLTDEERQAILDLPGDAEQVKPNRDFVPMGVAVDHSCLVVGGLVGRFGQTSEGGRQITALHIPGEMADLHSVVQTAPTSALQALSVTTILRIPHASLRTPSARFPAIAEAFWRDCMVDAAILSQWVVNVGRRDAKQRVAHLVCEMATRISGNKPTDGMTFYLPITQMQLADATGVTAVHVNRTLQALRTAGLLLWSRENMITLPNWKMLAQVGDFDPTYLQTDIPAAERMRIAAKN